MRKLWPVSTYLKRFTKGFGSSSGQISGAGYGQLKKNLDILCSSYLEDSELLPI
jgi:hypothetical protein